MRISFYMDDLEGKNKYTSNVFAIQTLTTTMKNKDFSGWRISNRINMLNYLVLIPSGDLFELIWIDQNKIARVEESREPDEWVFTKKHIDLIPQNAKVKLKNLKCYPWMLMNQGFFVNIYDDNQLARSLLYQNIPGVLSENHVVKYNKKLFFDNVKYLLSYQGEPELDIYTKNGNKYFIIAYESFCDFYDEDNNYHKLNNIEEVENFISFDDIVDIQGDFVDFDRDIREQSIVVDGKLWFNTRSK